MSEHLLHDDELIVHQAMRVLYANDRGTHTIPAEGTYPHTWLWDEVFADIGLRHADASRAAVGIASLFRGQWQNGMVPNMIFTKGRPFGTPPLNIDYVIWSSKLLNAQSPRNVATSGITQPPVIAEGIQRVGEKLPADERREFYKATIGKTAAYHSWIYRERNPRGDGLMSAVHAWESGMDNSPVWTEHMASLDWGKGAGIRHAAERTVQRALRHDLTHLPADERASMDEGLLNFDALVRLRGTRYDYRKIEDTYPLHIQDVHMNSILIRNNEILQQLAVESGEPLPDALQENMSMSRRHFAEMWDESDGLFYSRDAITGQPIKIPTIASLMPLYSGAISGNQAKRLVQHATNPNSFGLPYGIATVPAGSRFFREKGYWSGPAWVNTNWLMIDGMQRAMYTDEAAAKADQTIRMVALGGMREYFTPHTGRGLGTKNFSWTAGLTADLIYSRQAKA